MLKGLLKAWLLIGITSVLGVSMLGCQGVNTSKDSGNNGFNEVSYSSSANSSIYSDEFSIVSDIPGIQFKLPNDFENVDGEPVTEISDACIYGETDITHKGYRTSKVYRNDRVMLDIVCCTGCTFIKDNGTKLVMEHDCEHMPLTEYSFDHDTEAVVFNGKTWYRRYSLYSQYDCISVSADQLDCGMQYAYLHGDTIYVFNFVKSGSGGDAEFSDLHSAVINSVVFVDDEQ